MNLSYLLRIWISTIFLSISALAYDWPTTLFQDQFEVGDLYSWFSQVSRGSNSVCSIDTNHVYSGGYSARFSVGTGAESRTAYTTKMLPSTNTVYFRGFFNISSNLYLSKYYSLDFLTFGTPALGPVLRLGLMPHTDGTFRLFVRSYWTNNAPFTLDTWQNIEVGYHTGTGDGWFSVSQNNMLLFCRSNLTLTNYCTSINAGISGAFYKDNSNDRATVYLDDVVIDIKPIGSPSSSISLYVPDLRGRLGSPGLAVLSSHNSTDTLNIVLESSNGYTNNCYSAKATLARHPFKVDLRRLKIGTYTLVATLVDSSGNTAAKAQVVFDRNYEDDNSFSIDENNIFTLDGNPIFLLTPFVLQDYQAAKDWKYSNIINTLYGCDWNNKTVSGVSKYLDNSFKYNIKCFIPFPFMNGSIKGTSNELTVSLLKPYFETFAHDTNVAGWVFIDEPELYKYSSFDHKQWWEASKQYNGAKITHVNLMGNTFGKTDFNINLAHSYCYPYLCTDSIGFDMYPYEYTNNQSLVEMALHCERIQKWNFGLIPTTAYIQTQDIQIGKEGSAPTPDQIYMMAWLMVINGAKGIQWFHYFGITPDYSLKIMSHFGNRIKEFEKSILTPYKGPTFSRSPLCSTNVYFTTKNGTNCVFLFAANISATQCDLVIDSDLFNKQTVTELESNTVHSSGVSTFSFSMAPESVRIFNIPIVSSQIPVLQHIK